MTVHLVGAGPGDPGLLTRRGGELLARAQHVVYDRPTMARLVTLAPPTVTRHCVGKRGARPARPQAESGTGPATTVEPLLSEVVSHFLAGWPGTGSVC